MFGTRLASALVLIAFALTVTWLGGIVFFLAVLAVMSVLMWEWARIVNRDAAIAGTSVRWLWLGLGALYFGAAAANILWLRESAGFSFFGIVALIGVVGATDSGAYITGRSLGGPTMARQWSPGKTWAGFAGGLVAAVLAGLAAQLVLTGVVYPPGLAWALVLGLAAHGGDLLESGFKRRFGVKDSGSLLPGHGGALDRLDSLLAALLVAAAGYAAGIQVLAS